jgi:hypothetical protein
MKKLITLFFSFYVFIAFGQTFTSSGSFTVPAGVCTMTVEVWGAGGAGGSAVGTATPSARALAGGGGGGGYSKTIITVVPGQIIPYTVAPTTGANAGTTPLNGGASTFATVTAPGGVGGSCENSATAPAGNKSGTGGAGGIGATTNGGSGGTRTAYAGQTTGWTSGGGGGGAGTTTNGGDASNLQNGTGGTAGTADGGVGGNGASSGGTAGSTGTIVGGGGSGAFAAASTTFRNGGAGARGQIRVSFTVINLPVVTPGTITTFTNEPFSYQIVATNSPTSYGAVGLPASLTLNTTTGLITGTPPSGDAGTYIVTLSATNCAGTAVTQTLSLTLPVELTKFNATKEDNKTNLTWSTASEKNNSHFNIQRSKDSYRWENLGRVIGNDNSIVNRNYEFTDAKPLKGINYYRLEQVDHNGKINNSTVVSVNNGSRLEIVPMIQNNNQVTIKVYNDREENGIAQIIDISGRIVATQNISLENGSNLLDFDMSKNVSGTYVVKMITESGEQTQKMMILN